MSWLFGASMGWFVGGPVGAVVGGAIQHVFSSAKMKQIGQSDVAAEPEMVFISNLVAIMTKICMADGHISTEERRVIHKFFESSLGYSGENLKFIDAMIDETDRQNPDLKQIVFAFDRFANHEQRLILLDLAYNIAAVDHTITEGEQSAINDIITSRRCDSPSMYVSFGINFSVNVRRSITGCLPLVIWMMLSRVMRGIQ